MKVKKIKKRIEMSLKLLESLEPLKRSDEGLSLDEYEKRLSYPQKTLIAAYQKIEQQQEKIAELESENKSLKYREEHEYEEEFAGPAMG